MCLIVAQVIFGAQIRVSRCDMWYVQPSRCAIWIPSASLYKGAPMTPRDDHQRSIIDPASDALAHVAQIASDHAARNVFADDLTRKVDNAIRR